MKVGARSTPKKSQYITRLSKVVHVVVVVRSLIMVKKQV